MKYSQTLFQLELFCLNPICKQTAYLFMQRPEFIKIHRFQCNARSECAGLLRSQNASPCLKLQSSVYSDRGHVSRLSQPVKRRVRHPPSSVFEY